MLATEITARKEELTKIINNSSDADKQGALNNFLVKKIGDNYLTLDNNNIIGFKSLSDDLKGVNNQKGPHFEESSDVTYKGPAVDNKDQQTSQISH